MSLKNTDPSYRAVLEFISKHCEGGDSHNLIYETITSDSKSGAHSQSDSEAVAAVGNSFVDRKEFAKYPLNLGADFFPLPDPLFLEISRPPCLFRAPSRPVWLELLVLLLLLSHVPCDDIKLLPDTRVPSRSGGIVSQ